ncbi:MAG: response regulator transcription factor [Bacteroidales bacterium]|nr:response regulator transcription factor [Bacteroidales bacterium]
MDQSLRPRILVVEDDPTLCDTLQLNLELEGYQADVAYTAEDALKMDLAPYSLILLDVMLGEMSGFKLARHIKSTPALSHIPIIFCTARDSEDDMVTGLNLGADDYIFKPYTLRNVLTRIKTVLRRAQAATPTPSPTLSYEGLVLDLDSKRCTVDGKDIRLIKKEWDLLELLLSHQGRIFTREEILKRAWPQEVVVLERTVDVNITRLRQKLGPYGSHIVTRSGFGYGFE